MIPRAVDHVFRVTENMKQQGWEYTFEGQFLEIVRLSLRDFVLASHHPTVQRNDHRPPRSRNDDDSIVQQRRCHDLHAAEREEARDPP